MIVLGADIDHRSGRCAERRDEFTPESYARRVERIEDIAKDDKKLRELPGVGENMAEHIREVLKTGDYTSGTTPSPGSSVGDD